ncbi:hypothetical protein NKDENANG_00757 [Candidatus Entotheonellaceae bacterium PAL068K]
MQPQRLDLHYRIDWQGRWHVGSGYQSAVADRLLRRMGGRVGPPFVPGSQIKGVLRHQCERLAQALNLEVVEPHASSEEHNRRLVAHFTPLARSDLVVDRLFGSRYQGDCLFVANAMPVSCVESRASVRARTALDRVTGAVMAQHLFTTELAEGSINLRGSLRARHPVGVLTQDDDGFPYEYALLMTALLSLDALGGDKSVGLGRCAVNLEPKSLRWNGQPICLDDALKSFQDLEWNEMLDLLRQESAS